jgi:lysophospholipase L1-like esterase
MLAPVLRVPQRARATQFDELGPVNGAVVFLGDSISEGGLWSEWFPGVLTSNRGIGGETTAQVLGRLDSAIDSPRAVVLLAGTNDLAAGARVVEIVNRLVAIVEGILERSPECPIYLQSVMPRKDAFAAEIVELNELLRSMAEVRATTTFVDLWPALAAPDGSLRSEFTIDNLHLNGAGYAAWVEVLRQYIDD